MTFRNQKKNSEIFIFEISNFVFSQTLIIFGFCLRLLAKNNIKFLKTKTNSQYLNKLEPQPPQM